MKRLNKTFAMLACVTMLIVSMTAFAISAGAVATQNTDAGVSVPGINKPYKTLEELNIDMAAIDAKFPKRINMTYKDGKMLIPDLGAHSATLYIYGSSDSEAMNFELELIDGYWTADVLEDCSAKSSLVMNFDYPHRNQNTSWTISYDKCDRFYVNIYNNEYDVAIKIYDSFGSVTVEYKNGDNLYTDTYEKGSLVTHCVSSFRENNSNVATYDPNGKLKYCEVKDTYYIPDKGWSRIKSAYFACDPPAGYAGKSFEEILGNKLSLICNHDDFTDATCTTPSTCKVCGQRKGSTTAHSWGHLSGVCTVCGTKVIPEFTYPTTSYATLKEVGFDYAKVTAAFLETLEVKYENGKYMIKDVGATKAELAHGPYFERTEMSLADGWWSVDVDATAYSTQDIYVYFSGNGWTFQYKNGNRTGELYIISSDYTQTALVYFNTETVAFSYKRSDKSCRDSYLNGTLNEQQVTVRINGVNIQVNYNGNGVLTSATVTDGSVAYYDTENGWWSYGSGGSKIPCAPPANYASIDALMAVAPPNIKCSHPQYTASGCDEVLKCTVCSAAKEGNPVLGHDIVIDKAVAPTCTQPGLTEGSHCSRCDGATVAQEDVPALGHKYDSACDSTCNDCGATVAPADHVDTDKDSLCDECGAELPEADPSIGLIIGIAAGAVVAIAVCIFLLLKKKKTPDTN